MPWIRLEPEYETDGRRYAWRLVVELDNDWQDWKAEGGLSGGDVRFSVHISDDMVDDVSRAVETSRGETTTEEPTA